jgi:hypothetical protein
MRDVGDPLLVRSRGDDAAARQAGYLPWVLPRALVSSALAQLGTLAASPRGMPLPVDLWLDRQRRAKRCASKIACIALYAQSR